MSVVKLLRDHQNQGRLPIVFISTVCRVSSPSSPSYKDLILIHLLKKRMVMGPCFQSAAMVVEEITSIHRSLPSRPAVDEVEAAVALVRNVDREEQSRFDVAGMQRRGPAVPEELFSVFQEMQRGLVGFQCREQKRDALKLLDLESAHQLFDELIQRASNFLQSSSNSPAGSPANSVYNTTVNYSEIGVVRSPGHVSRDDSYVMKKKSSPSMYIDEMTVGSHFSRGSLLNPASKTEATSGGGNGKLSLIQLASLIEASWKKGEKDFCLRNKLGDQIDWLPDSIGKLSGLISLDISENRIVALPSTIGALSSLTRLDLHSNLIPELPDSLGYLLSLLYLDLRANQLTALPPSIGKLVDLLELDLSSNRLASLPDAIGNLTSLRKLNLQTNDIEELPYTIGHCASLVEFRADYNRLRGLPEAAGKLESLEVLSIRYNNIKSLPTTMSSLLKLKEINVSFNELESIPESLCFATSLVKLNVGNNFADLRSLPRSIGNLEMLEELNISNNQIRFFPDSFGMLSQLRVLNAEENPLEVPPRHIAEMGAQDAVQYMADLVAKREVKPQPTKVKNTWAQFFFFSRPNKRKHDSMEVI